MDGLCLAARPAVASSSFRLSTTPQHRLRSTLTARCTAQSVAGAQPQHTRGSRMQPAARASGSPPIAVAVSLHKHRRPAPLGRSRKGHAAVPLSQLIQAETVALAGLINPLHASPRSDPLRCRLLLHRPRRRRRLVVTSSSRVGVSSCSSCCPLCCLLPVIAQRSTLRLSPQKAELSPWRPAYPWMAGRARLIRLAARWLPRCTSRITGLWP